MTLRQLSELCQQNQKSKRGKNKKKQRCVSFEFAPISETGIAATEWADSRESSRAAGPSTVETDEDQETWRILDEVAVENFARFHNVPIDKVSPDMVRVSSAGVAGWANYEGPSAFDRRQALVMDPQTFLNIERQKRK